MAFQGGEIYRIYGRIILSWVENGPKDEFHHVDYGFQFLGNSGRWLLIIPDTLASEVL